MLLLPLRILQSAEGKRRRLDNARDRRCRALLSIYSDTQRKLHCSNCIPQHSPLWNQQDQGCLVANACGKPRSGQVSSLCYTAATYLTRHDFLTQAFTQAFKSDYLLTVPHHLSRHPRRRLLRARTLLLHPCLALLLSFC